MQLLINNNAVMPTLFDLVENKDICGMVMCVNQQLQQFKLRTSDEVWERIKLDGIIYVTI